MYICLSLLVMALAEETLLVVNRLSCTAKCSAAVDVAEPRCTVTSATW